MLRMFDARLSNLSSILNRLADDDNLGHSAAIPFDLNESESDDDK